MIENKNQDAFDNFVRQEVKKAPITYQYAHWDELHNALNFHAKSIDGVKNISKSRRFLKWWLSGLSIMVIIGIFYLSLHEPYPNNIHDQKIFITKDSLMMQNENAINTIVIEETQKQIPPTTGNKEFKDAKSNFDEESYHINDENNKNSVENNFVLPDSTLIKTNNKNLPIKIDTLNIKKKKKKHLLW